MRKGQELVLTYMIEHVMSKERILELYLNVAEWGVGVFGAEAAAKHYFNTSAAGLAPASRPAWPPCSPTRASTTATATPTI